METIQILGVREIGGGGPTIRIVPIIMSLVEQFLKSPRKEDLRLLCTLSEEQAPLDTVGLLSRDA